VDLRF